MVNERDTSISKLLLLPDPSRSPKIERRNDLFVNIVSTLMVWRERAWKSTPTLKGTGALEKDTWPQGARETVSDSPTKKISSQLSIFSSLLGYSHVLAEQSNALSLHLSLSLSWRELTSPQQKKEIIQNGSSLFRSIPTGGVSPRFFFFFFPLSFHHLETFVLPPSARFALHLKRQYSHAEAAENEARHNSSN